MKEKEKEGNVGEILKFGLSLTLLFIMPCQARIDEAVYYFEINAEISKGTSNQRSGSRPRSIVCYSAVQKLAMVGGQLAHKLNLTFSAVNKLISHGRHNPVSKDIATELFD